MRVDTEREIIVDHIQWQIVLSVFVLASRIRIGRYIKAPTIQQNRVRVTNVGQDFTDRFVRIALRPQIITL